MGRHEKAGSHHDMNNIFSISDSWPWLSQEELQHPLKLSTASPAAPLFPVCRSPSPAPPAVAPHSKPPPPAQPHLISCSPHSLSLHPPHSTALSSFISSSASSSSLSASQSHATFSPSLSSALPIRKLGSSLWDDDDDDDDDDYNTTRLPPIHPHDYLKTLLTRLAACVSSIQTVYARHQTAAAAAVNLHSLQVSNADKGHAGKTMAVISATDKAMVQELQSLAHLHSQLALLPRRLTFKELGGDIAVNAEEDAMKMQLKRYEDIIARFHDEIWRKDAVTEALKETLARSILKGEKLQQRVKVLEAKLTQQTHVSDSIGSLQH